jgi:hypothetical protein
VFDLCAYHNTQMHSVQVCRTVVARAALNSGMANIQQISQAVLEIVQYSNLTVDQFC